MFKKNDPLVEVSKKIMQENETRRQVVLLVNESLGIEDKKVLPRELFAEYDTILAEAQSVALKEGIDRVQLDEVSLKKAIAAYRSSSEGEHWNRNDYEGNDKAANAYRKQKNKFKSYIHKKGGDKAVGDAEKGAKQDIEGKKYSSYSNDTISARKDVLDKEKKSGRWGVFSKGPKKGHLKQAGEHKRYMKVTHDSVMKDAKKKVNLPESEQLDEVTIKAIVKKVANELPSRKKKIEDLNRRAMQKPTIKGWANAQKRVNAAVNEEQLDESVRTPLPKVSKKKAIKEDTSIEAINEEIYDNLLANLIEAYQSSEDAFNDMVDSLTEEQLQILGFTEGIQ